MRTITQFNVLDKDFQGGPYATYSSMHSSNAVLFDERLGAYFFGHHADVLSILQSPSFTTRPLAARAEPVMGDRVLAQMEGSEHRSRRNTILSVMSARNFREQYKALIETVAEQLLSEHLERGEIDLIKDFGRNYSILVTLSILGLPTDRYEEVATWHAGVASFITSLEMTDDERRWGLECSRNIIRYLKPIVNARKSSGGDCLIAKLGRREGSEEMSTSEIVALILNVILAASEPADKALGYLFYHLLSSPGLLERVVKDRDLLGSAVRETLRLNSPVQLIPRETSEAVTLSGISLHKGALVFCMIGAANRDPSAFSRPTEFVIDRSRSGAGTDQNGSAAYHLAFGTGRHVCVGATFALLQIELTANFILDRLKDIELTPGFLIHEAGLYTRGPSELKIKFRSVAEATARA